MKLHPSITVNRVCDAVERRMTSLDNPGFCVYSLPDENMPHLQFPVRAAVLA
jgi:hypothetical protein